MFPRPVGIGDRSQKTGGIRICADQTAIRLLDDGIHRSNLLTYAAGIVDQIEHGYLVRYRHIATAPGRIGATLFNIAGQFVRCDVAGAIIGLDIQPFEPEFMNQRRLALRDRIADHLGIRNICGHDGKIDRMRR